MVVYALETSAKHHIPQAKNIPYQPLLIKPIYNNNGIDDHTCSRSQEDLYLYPELQSVIT